MKKVVFVLLFMFVALGGYSQDLWNPTRVYCNIVGIGNFTGTKMKVSIDFGQARKLLDGNNNRSLVDKDGKDIKFNSMVDALNYMALLGWKFEQAYVLTEDAGMSKQNVYHYLLSRELKEGESIDAGIYTRRDFKDDQKDNVQKVEEQELDKVSKKKRKVVDDVY